MRKLFLLLSIGMLYTAQAQKFKIKRVITNGFSVKIKGTVDVKDESIEFDYENDKFGDVVIRVIPGQVLTSNGVTQKIFMATNELGEVNVGGSTRFKLTLTSDGKHQSLIMDSKDNFTGAVTSSMFLIENL